MNPTLVLDNGSATTYTNVSCLAYVPRSTTVVTIRVDNLNEFPLDFYSRKPSTTEIAPVHILEGRSSFIEVNLDGDLSFEYKINQGYINIFILDVVFCDSKDVQHIKFICFVQAFAR